MRNDELKLLIKKLTREFGTDQKMKQQICLIFSELLAKIEELDERFPIKHPVGRPKKGEER